MQQDLSNACKLLPCTQRQRLLPTRNPHCFQEYLSFSPPLPWLVCSVERMPYSLSLFYSYPLSKAQLKSHLLMKPSVIPQRDTINPSLKCLYLRSSRVFLY